MQSWRSVETLADLEYTTNDNLYLRLESTSVYSDRLCKLKVRTVYNGEYSQHTLIIILA